MELDVRTAPAGETDPQSAYRELSTNQDAQLVDVRTRAEWSFVGAPDLAAIGKEPLLIEWQTWPSMAVAGDFIQQLRDQLAARGVDQNAPLYFLCRSGVRSGAAALAAAKAGFPHTFNVTAGFEGPADGDRHRGTVAGWKAGGLPWSQS